MLAPVRNSMLAPYPAASRMPAESPFPSQAPSRAIAECCAADPGSFKIRSAFTRFIDALHDRRERLLAPSARLQSLHHLRGYRRGHPDRLAFAIERHHDLAGVELQPWPPRARCRAVDRVAHDRPTHCRAVPSQLMGWPIVG